MGTYRDLLAWQKAMDLVVAIYETVRSFPRSELFLLSQQMRAAAISIPCNIAEGRGRYTIADQTHFYRQARGSAYELQTQIEISRRLELISDENGATLSALAAEVGRLINGLLASQAPKA